jgi:hypothetical protein
VEEEEFTDATTTTTTITTTTTTTHQDVTAGVATYHKWWNRGMLLAALIECGGDAKKAGVKLCQGNPGKRNKQSKLAARIYRREMDFVSQVVDFETMLSRSELSE